MIIFKLGPVLATLVIALLSHELIGTDSTQYFQTVTFLVHPNRQLAH